MRNGFIVSDLSASYGTNVILRDISFSIEPGSFTGLLGLNGSGKTTMFKAISGLIPMKGRILVNGTDCTAMPEKERARYISHVLQKSSLKDGFTVKDVVLMGAYPYLKFYENPSAEMERTAEKILADMGILDKKDRDFSRLSEGEKQLAAISRTLLQNTPVILLDEPDSSLDYSNRHKILAMIKRIINTQEKSGVITIHDPNFAMKYCDRLLILNGGVLCGEIIPGITPLDEAERLLSILYGDIKLYTFGSGENIEYFCSRK